MATKAAGIAKVLALFITAAPPSKCVQYCVFGSQTLVFWAQNCYTVMWNGEVAFVCFCTDNPIRATDKLAQRGEFYAGVGKKSWA